MTDLSKMSDSDLASWQAGWKEQTGNYILAEREWERRMISHEVALQKQLAAARTYLKIASFNDRAFRCHSRVSGNPVVSGPSGCPLLRA